MTAQETLLREFLWTEPGLQTCRSFTLVTKTPKSYRPVLSLPIDFLIELYSNGAQLVVWIIRATVFGPRHRAVQRIRTDGSLHS